MLICLLFIVSNALALSHHPGGSHFFAHRMFNGAKKYGPKEIDRNMEKNGGSNNAFTSNDLTV